VQHEEEERYFEVEKANTQFNVFSLIKQIVCTSTREEGRNFIKTLEEYNEKHSHF